MTARTRKEITQQQLWSDNLTGKLILTVNRRLSLEIRHQYNIEQEKRGNQTWETINAKSWGDWLTDLYLQLEDLGQNTRDLLTPQQERLLWEQIIREHSRSQPMLDHSGTAQMAQDAWKLVQSWDIPTERLISLASNENREYLNWSDQYHQECEKRNLTDQSRLPDQIYDISKNREWNGPTEIILAGFDEINPQQNRLFDLLDDMGCSISILIENKLESDICRIEIPDPQQEIEVAARWALAKLQANPSVRVGIVIPQLHQLRNHVDAVFKRCFHPVSILPGSEPATRLYNISVGIVLSNCPLVTDAFSILKLAIGAISAGELSRLLRSPLLAGNEEIRMQRSTLDAYLRRTVGERTITLDTLIRSLLLLDNDSDRSFPELLERLKLFRSKLDHLGRKQSPQEWIDTFNQILECMGWPNYPKLSSEEYQQVESFNQLLWSFQSLGKIQEELYLHEAYEMLYKMAGEEVFQPKTEETPIQILGILEASGLNFDHLWVMGLTDDQWPSISAPNPLLPVSLQRELEMPHSSPQRELSYAESVTERLVGSAPEVILSNAVSDGINTLRTSPLILDYRLSELENLVIGPQGSITQLGFRQVDVQCCPDDKGPPLKEGTHVSGGSGLLADQSACPFRAFARHRLGAIPLEEPISGVDAKSRGSIIHHILQQVWKRLQSHERLINISESDLEQLVSDIVSQELEQTRPRKPTTLTPRFLQIEQSRICQLIIEWLQHEKERMPFTISSLEQRQRIKLGGIELDIIADRVDTLNDGRSVIVDYKTGKLKNRGWFEERISEPQLPLYAVTNDSSVAGVFLAGISRDNLKFLGTTDTTEVVPGAEAYRPSAWCSESNWDELIHAWKERLEILADEILNGLAKVDPHDPNNDCRYCPLPSFCRIHEMDAEVDSEDKK